MSYKHPSQIYSLMKANQTTTQIADQLGCHTSAITRELGRNEGLRGHRPKQACEWALSRTQRCRNAREVGSWVLRKADCLLCLQWCPEQMASKLPVSHGALGLHVYADKAHDAKPYKNQRCHTQKRKRFIGGQDRRGQTPNRRPLSERPAHVEGRVHVGHWRGDTVIGANHKKAIETVVARKSGYTVIEKVANKTAGLVSVATVKRLQPLGLKIKVLTGDSGNGFFGHDKIDKALGSTSYFARPFISWKRGSNEDLSGMPSIVQPCCTSYLNTPAN
jgi:IS30 family transposase